MFHAKMKKPRFHVCMKQLGVVFDIACSYSIFDKEFFYTELLIKSDL